MVLVHKLQSNISSKKLTKLTNTQPANSSGPATISSWIDLRWHSWKSYLVTKKKLTIQ